MTRALVLAVLVVALAVVIGTITRSATLQHPEPRTPATIETVNP